jgi:hypothetical protein
MEEAASISHGASLPIILMAKKFTVIYTRNGNGGKGLPSKRTI